MKFIKDIIFIKLSIIFVIFSLDRISKTYVLDLFNETQFNEIYLSEFLNIYFIWNEGIAFGLLNFNEHSFYKIITLIITIVSIIIFIFAMKTKNYKGYFFAIIFGGAIGNLYDRVKFSAVPDFIDLHIGNYHWFIFNVANIFISL